MKVSSKAAIGALICAASFQSVTSFAAEKAALRERAPAAQKAEFDVYLPLEHQDQLDKLLIDLQDPKSTSYHHWLKPAEFHARFAASPEKLSAIDHELAGYGLATTHVGPQKIHVTGSVDAVEHALITELHTATFKTGKTTLAAARPMTLPSSLAASHATILGLSGFIHMQSHAHLGAKIDPAVAEKRQPESPDNRYTSHGGYWFDDLKQAYKYPSYKAYTGKGSTIGILMETDYNPPDMVKYFSHEKLATPSIKTVNINGGAPFGGASFETTLDLQQTGGMAPKAQLVLYNLPSLSDENILDGLSTIVETNVPDVVNMSFGGPEGFYTPAYNNGVDYSSILGLFEDAFKQGNAQGITFVASSGDSGGLALPPLNCLYEDSTIGCGDFQHGIETPGSSPHVTAVGGTNLTTKVSDTTLDSTYVSESAFYDPLQFDIFYGTYAGGAVWGSGGGDSIYFSKPAYQQLVNTHSLSRTTPDLALHMGGCPGGAVQPCHPEDSFDYLVFDTYYYGVIGTSASSPDFAGLVALKIERLGTRLGNDNYDIYALAALQNAGVPLTIFHNNIHGDNGAYKTEKGYNRVVGNGTVEGINYLLAPTTPAAGIPQTPSNP